MASKIPLLIASYVARSIIAEGQRCVNLYPEQNPQEAPQPVTFYGTPGKEVWSTVPGSGGIRCTYRTSNGMLMAVRGRQVYRYSSGSWVYVADMGTDDGIVNAADNGVNAVFVDGTKVAPTINIKTLATGVMTGDGWLGSAFVAYVDQRLVFFQPDTQVFFWTDLLSLNIDPLSFASAEGLPDQIISMIADHRELWFLGETTLEVYSSSSDPDLPFARFPSGFNHYGCEAKYSVKALDNTIYWLGKSENGGRLVFRAQNYQPAIISTPAIAAEFGEYERVDDAIAWSYQDGQHAFYVLTFPTAGKTWAFDVLTSQWHERAYRMPDNSLTRERTQCHVYHDGMSLVGDFEDGRIYRMSMDIYTDDGEPIPRLKDFPQMGADGRQYVYTDFQLDVEAAVGNPDDPEPMVRLSWSNDSGATFGSSLERSLGPVGKYWKRLKWNRLGRGRRRVFRVYTAAKAKIAFQGGFLTGTSGT
ncbi:hypothetical protein AB4120_14860 [Cupriavidus sp. 2KB_3]|uniref:hypothetical protein n=1 Tax=Cupriavidus sp. 2KB_3 TaxID=3232980 RepID=UPI003F8E6654